MSIQDLRKTIGERLLFSPAQGTWTGSADDYGSLPPEKAAQLNAEMKKYIRENPAEFTSTQVQIANRPDPDGPSEYGFLDGVSSFAGEAGRQAERLNPFSALNWPSVKLALTAGFLIWATVKILPYLNKPKI